MSIESITPDYKLNINDKVRQTVPQKTLKKTRCNVILYADAITDISGKSIIMNDPDFSATISKRSQAIPINISKKGS
jgi:hypothetical protein